MFLKTFFLIVIFFITYSKTDSQVCRCEKNKSDVLNWINQSYDYYNNKQYLLSYVGYMYTRDFLIYYKCSDTISKLTILDCEKSLDILSEYIDDPMFFFEDTNEYFSMLSNFQNSINLAPLWHTTSSEMILYNNIMDLKSDINSIDLTISKYNYKKVTDEFWTNNNKKRIKLLKLLENINEFLLNYKQSKHYDSILNLKSKVLWINTIVYHDYLKYITLCENEKFLNEAKEIYEDYLFNTVIDEYSNNSSRKQLKELIESCYNYLYKFRYGQNYCFVENILWETIVKLDKRKYYDNYIDIMENGRFIYKAYNLK